MGCNQFKISDAPEFFGECGPDTPLQPASEMASPYAYSHKSGLSANSPSVSSRIALRVQTEEKMPPQNDGKRVFLRLWVFELFCFSASVSSLIGEPQPGDIYHKFN